MHVLENNVMYILVKEPKSPILPKQGSEVAPSAILGLNVFLDSLNLPKLGLIILLVRLYCHHSQFSDDYDYLACVLHTIPFVIGKDVHMAQMGSRGHVYNFMPLSTSARVFL